MKIVNVQINGATISLTCLSSLYFVLSLGSPTSIHPPHTQYFGLFILHIYLFRGKNRFEKLPNWPLVQHWGGITQLAHFTMFPVIFNTKARPFWVIPFLEACLGPSNSNQIGSFCKWDYPACIQNVHHHHFVKVHRHYADPLIGLIEIGPLWLFSLPQWACTITIRCPANQIR